MKFHDVAIGQRFELDGAVYIKTSPVLASRDEGGEKKFLARYLAVRPLDGAEPRPAERAGPLLRTGAVLAAFEAYHARSREVIEPAVPADRWREIADVLEDERQNFIDSILKA